MKSINKEFLELLLKEKSGGLIILREYLVKYKEMKMDKSQMLENLQVLRKSNLEMEDIILELMDFVAGYCQSELSVFNN